MTGTPDTAVEAARCLNCGAPLAGKYCAACGQRDDRHLHSLGHFLAEAVEGLTHADSRLWRTLWALLARPGFLTQEFFAGRRQRYLPPFRLYIVVSLLFFIVVALVSNAALVDFGPAGNAAGAGSPAGASEATPGTVACSGLTYDGPGGSWLQPKLILGCQKSMVDSSSLGRAFLHNVPRAMFFLLPLIAGFMWLIYWRPRRYYVEHLLFGVHNHAMIFALGTLLVPLFWLLRGTRASDPLTIVVMLWLTWYLFRALRVYYGQGRRRSALKLLFMGGTYLVASILMLVFTVLYSVATL